jgi:predicted short-subunit dehydrogenase-like oxidoreductase (DUF2520 family)
LYQAEVKATLDFSTSDSTVFIIATADDAIQEIAREIILPEEAVLVHTSGGQPLSVLQFAATPHLGVLYPLQTFSKPKKVDFREIPLFIESSDEKTEFTMMPLAKGISNHVYKIGSEERKALHVAAVFASNFTNHMLTMASDILQQNSLNFAWLIPLITETINKSIALGPEAAQTGPAKRGDLEVLDEHYEFLRDQKLVAKIYKLVSQHIIEKYNPE